MRRKRQLTATERWELGVFMALLVAGCMLLTALLNLGQLPRLFASAAPGESTRAEPVALRPLDGDAGELMTPLPLPRTQGERLTDVLPQILPSPAERLAEAPPLPRKPAVETRTYAGKQYRYIKTLKLRVTAYAPDPRCTWPYPGTTTASGLSVKTNGGHLVAADTSVIPMYSLVSVPGYAGGGGVPVLDRGQAIKGNRLDVLLPTFEQAKNWGSRMIDVKVYAPIK